MELAAILSGLKESVYSMGGVTGRAIPSAKPVQLVHFRIKLAAAAVILVVLSTEQDSRDLHRNKIVLVRMLPDHSTLWPLHLSCFPVQLILSCWSVVLKGLGVRSPLTARPTDLQPPPSAPLIEDCHISVSNSIWYGELEWSCALGNVTMPLHDEVVLSGVSSCQLGWSCFCRHLPCSDQQSQQLVSWCPCPGTHCEG